MAEPNDLADSIGRPDRVRLYQWNEAGTALVEVDATIDQLGAAVVQQIAASPTLASRVQKTLAGEGAPSNSNGIDGDSYVDLDTGNTYLKASGAWSLTGNIKGPEGETGPQGNGFVVGDPNSPYDIYFHVDGAIWFGHIFSTSTTEVFNFNALGAITQNGTAIAGGSSPTIGVNALLGNGPDDSAGTGYSVSLSDDFAIGAGRTLAASPDLLRNLTVWPSLENPVRDHGAVGDGVTDDSVAINAAVAAAISAGTRFVQVDASINCPTLDPAAGDVIFVGRGALVNEPTKRKFVIPSMAPPPPPPARGVIARAHCPTFTAAIRDTGAATVVLCGDSVSTPMIGDQSATSTLWQRLLAKIRADNPLATINGYDRGIGGQRVTNLDGLPDAFPLWYTSTGRDWLEYIEDLAPDLVIINFARNDGLAFSMASLRSILAKVALWAKVPDIVLSTSVADKVTDSASGSAAFTAQNRFDYASQGMRTFALANGLGLIDLARHERLWRFGFDPCHLPLIRDNAVTGGSATNLKYSLTLPFTWPTSCFDYGGIFYIGAGGWTTLGHELLFDIGYQTTLLNKGNKFRIARDSSTGQIKYRVDVTQTSLGAEADYVFKDWTYVPGWFVGPTEETGFTFQVSGPNVYFEPSDDGVAVPIVNRWTPGYYGHVPRLGGMFQPVISCAAGSVSSVLKLANGTLDGYVAPVTGNPYKPNLYMPQVVDADTNAPHPGSMFWEFLQQTIDALDFSTAA